MSLEHTKYVFRVFKKISDGAHGNTRGISGSLTPCSLFEVLSTVDVYGRNILDIGAGTCVVLAAALTGGASKVHGIELPARNVINFPDISRRSLMEFKDIEKVLLASYTNCSYKYNSFPEIDR